MKKISCKVKDRTSGKSFQKIRLVGRYFYVVLFSCLVSFCAAKALFGSDSVLPSKLGQALSAFASSIGVESWIANRLLIINAKQLFIFLCIFIAFLLLGLSILHGKTKFIRFCYRYRFYIASAILLVSVLFKLNGTSLYMWSNYLKGAEQYKPIIGSAKAIRSDEWAVWSVFTISQGFEGWPAVNQAIAGGSISTLWISVGGIPANNIALIFKPLYWGFLLLGTERGFSFLWTLRLLLLFFVSFELAMQYTNKNTWLSFCAAVLLTFSPYVQWWFSQSVAEVLIFSQGMLLCLIAYVQCSNRTKRIFIAALFAYCMGCFVMIAYVSWLISTFYVVLIVALVILISNHKSLRKADIPTLLLPVAIAAAYLLVIALSDKATLISVQNSVYPGERLVTGGGLFNTASYFTGLYSLFLPLREAPFSNSCELSCFLTFAPAGMILACYSIFKSKKKDALSIALIAFEFGCLYFLIVGVPAAFAKATLLSQCSRMNIALGLADSILLFRNLSFSRGMPLTFVISSTFVSTAYNILMLLHFYQVRELTLVGFILLYLAIFYLLFHYQYDFAVRQRILTFALFCLMLSVGAFVNPIQQGISCVKETNLVKALESIENTADDIYILEGDWPLTDAPLLAGKTCFDSTQVYPNTEKWKAVDATGQYEDIYNRFCHISLNLVDSETRFLLQQTNHIRIDFCMDDLKTYGIRYLITTKEYSSSHNSHFTLVGTANEWHIYQITYDEPKP